MRPRVYLLSDSEAATVKVPTHWTEYGKAEPTTRRRSSADGVSMRAVKP